MTNLDRSEINRGLAKAIAYKQCGKHDKAGEWAVQLLDLLELGGIVSSEARSRLQVPRGWAVAETSVEG